eukprot:jgi/Orpsp1_1/1183405/evm.model.c7180000085059.1
MNEIKRLIEGDANVDYCGDKDNIPLIITCLKGNKDIIRYSIENNPDINKKKRT